MVAANWGLGWSLIGVLVGVLGFGLTIYLVHRSKSAAEAAREAAKRNTTQLRKTLALSSITSTINVAQEIRRLQRENAWPIALERYGELKSLLIRFRAENPFLENDQRATLQSIISQTSNLEGAVEELVVGRRQDEDLARWNRVLAGILEKLEALSASLKLTEEHYE